MKQKSDYQKLLAEAWEGVPQEITSLTPEEINRMAAEDTERITEGRNYRRSLPPSPHD